MNSMNPAKTCKNTPLSPTDSQTDAVDQMVAQWRSARPDLDEKLHLLELLARVNRLQRTFVTHMKVLRSEFDLTLGEIDMLFTLRRSGPPFTLTAGCFIKRVMVTASAITNRLDQMEHKGLIRREREDTDRRTVKIILTDHGKEVTDKLIEAHLTDYERIFSPLSDTEYDAATAALRKLLIASGDTALE